MRNSAMFYLVVLGIAVLGAVGDIGLYRGARAGSPAVVVLGMASWFLSLLLFAGLVRWSDCTLSVSFVLCAAIHIAVVVGFDFLLESTALSTCGKLGVALTVVGILCIEFGQNCASTERESQPAGSVTDLR